MAFALALLLTAGGAFAQAEDPAAQKQEAARQAFSAAEQAYQVGRFHEAIDGYTRAYELTQYPDLLFNLAQCHRHLENWERAAFFYRRYLAQAPEPQTNQAIAQELLAEVERRRAEAEAKAAARAQATQSAPPLVVPVPAAALAPDPQPAASPAVPMYKRWWFWAGVGAVIAAGATTAVVMNAPPPKGTLGEIRF